MKNIKRVFASVTVIVIVLLLTATFIRALMGADRRELTFWIYIDVLLPVFIYAAFLINKLLRKYLLKKDR